MSIVIAAFVCITILQKLCLVVFFLLFSTALRLLSDCSDCSWIHQKKLLNNWIKQHKKNYYSQKDALRIQSFNLHKNADVHWGCNHSICKKSPTCTEFARLDCQKIVEEHSTCKRSIWQNCPRDNQSILSFQRMSLGCMCWWAAGIHICILHQGPILVARL